MTILVIGVLTLLLAGFAPWIAIKMVHFAGDTFHAVHSQARVDGRRSNSRRRPQKVALRSRRSGRAQATSGQRALAELTPRSGSRRAAEQRREGERRTSLAAE